jgi:hypothetical protein
MGRSTFEGPVLSGDNRFGPLRNTGYTDLVQYCDIDLTNTTANTAFYSGGSGQFVNGNNIPNALATVYSPSATVYPPVAQTIPADTAANIYRGAVMYLPYGSNLNDVYIDCGVVPVVSGGSAAISSSTVYVSNNYTAAAGTPKYFSTGTISTVGRQSLSTFTAAQINAQASTTGDITNPPSQYGGGGNANPGGNLVSQVVFTLAIVGTNLDTRVATYAVAGVAITNTTGSFSCTSNAFLAVGQKLTLSGTYGGTGSISGYTDPTTYLVSAVSGGAGTVTAFTLTNLDGTAITTTAGTPTGITYTISTALAGRFFFTCRYTQLDGSIGTQTVYPYGNLD